MEAELNREKRLRRCGKNVAHSSSMADAVKTTCQECNKTSRLSALRGHTRKCHNLTITRYKELHGNLQLLEEVHHPCGLCGDCILLDSDAIASHLHVKHAGTTHKQYNDDFMATSKNTFMTKDLETNAVKEEDIVSTPLIAPEPVITDQPSGAGVMITLSNRRKETRKEKQDCSPPEEELSDKTAGSTILAQQSENNTCKDLTFEEKWEGKNFVAMNPDELIRALDRAIAM